MEVPRCESGIQILRRVTSAIRPSLQNLDNDLFPDKGPHPQKVIEIFGNQNTGKSIVVMEIMARVVLPSDFGGKGAEVVLFNLDNKFPLLQFTRIMEKIVNLSQKVTTAEEVKEIVESSMKCLHVYNCYSPEEFDLAFYAFKKLLINNTNISLIAIDSICAFYWLDCKQKAIKMETHYNRNVEKMKDLCIEFGLVGVYTRPSYFAKECPGRNLADYVFELILSEEGVQGFELKITVGEKISNKFIKIDNFGINVLD